MSPHIVLGGPVLSRKSESGQLSTGLLFKQILENVVIAKVHGIVAVCFMQYKIRSQTYAPPHAHIGVNHSLK